MPTSLLTGQGPFCWAYYGDTTPPIPGVAGFDESLHIQRDILLDMDFYGSWEFTDIENPEWSEFYIPWSEHFVFDDYVIPDYNPEWVSIDIMGYGFSINGRIDHECSGPIVPESATMLLLGSGLLGLAELAGRSF